MNPDMLTSMKNIDGSTTTVGLAPKATETVVSFAVGLPVAGKAITLRRIRAVIETGNGPLSFYATVVAAGKSLLLTGAKLSGAEGLEVRAIRGTGAILKFFSIVEAEAKAKGFKTLNWEYARVGERPGKHRRPTILKKFLRTLD